MFVNFGQSPRRSLTAQDKTRRPHYRKSECYSPGDTGRAMALYNLADFLDDRLVEIDNIANLGQAIMLHRSSLDLHPAGRLDCHLQEGGTLVELPWTFVTWRVIPIGHTS